MNTDNKEGHYKTYEEYSKNLRIWLVAFGIGGPILIATEENIATKISASDDAEIIVKLFLVGVFLQIAISLINKYNNWWIYNYYDFNKEADQQSKAMKFCDKLSNSWWLDCVFDVLSIALFVWATAKVLFVIT